jgi:hypothetical protein
VLLAKIDGSKLTWAYNSLLWNTSILMNEADLTLDKNEAKLAAFVNFPISALRVGFSSLADTDLPASWLDLHLPRQFGSLQEALLSVPVNTSAARSDWKKLLGPFGSLQRHCNMQGINQPSGGVRARIGIVGNNQAHCGSCDSGIGFGLEDPRNHHCDYAAGGCAPAFLKHNPLFDGLKPDNGHSQLETFGYILGYDHKMELAACPDVSHRLTATASSISGNVIADTGTSSTPWYAEMSNRIPVFNASLSAFVFGKQDWGIRVDCRGNATVIGSSTDGLTIAFWWLDQSDRQGCRGYSMDYGFSMPKWGELYYFFGMKAWNGLKGDTNRIMVGSIGCRHPLHDMGVVGSSSSSTSSEPWHTFRNSSADYVDDPGFLIDSPRWRFISVAYHANGTIEVFADGISLPLKERAWSSSGPTLTGKPYTWLSIGFVRGSMLDFQVYDYVLSQAAMQGLTAGTTSSCRQS